MLIRTAGRRLRVLTWHVHGNYLFYLSQAPHDFYLVTKPGHPPGYAGKVGALPWGDNVHEVGADRVAAGRFDCVLYQHRDHYEHDRLHLLSESQRALPSLYLEHDPPQENPFAQRHWAQAPGLTLIHVTAFNRLMWDSGATPTALIEHGVLLPADVRYSGALERGIVVVNHLQQRGRRLGADLYDSIRRRVPLDLIGMDAPASQGIGEVRNPDVPAFVSRYRFFFNPIRWTSLGLAIVEAMMVGMPIVGLATTELPSVIRNDENGFVHNSPDELCRVMALLLREPKRAHEWGRQARRTAMERFHIGRFVADWNHVFSMAAA